MRKKWTRPESGTIRLVTRFLWLPLTINLETRWLERVTWEERAEHLARIFSKADAGWRWTKRQWAKEAQGASRGRQ